jgi:thiol-disulfide isomerase/thioredoxin
MSRNLLTLFVVFAFAFSAIAQDDAKKAQPANFGEAKTVEEVETRLKEASTAIQAELQAAVQGSEASIEAIAPFFEKMSNNFLAAGEQVFKVAKNDEEKLKGYQMKMTAYRQADQKEKVQCLEKLAKEAGLTDADKRNQEKMMPIIEKMQDMKTAVSEKITALEQELLAFAKKSEKLPAEIKEQIITQIEGNAKFKVGNELKLTGKTLDNKDFNLASLKGKVVLVKFTATWCGPCKGEIPGMKEAYKKYHDKGFEIVSVYVWERGDDPIASVKKTVEEEGLPWLIVSEAATTKAGGKAQGTEFGIQGVPTMLLFGKDGKIIDNDARGSKLQRKLADLFK